VTGKHFKYLIYVQSISSVESYELNSDMRNT